MTLQEILELEAELTDEDTQLNMGVVEDNPTLAYAEIENLRETSLELIEELKKYITS